MATMRAARFHAEDSTLRVDDVPVPEPGPGEVLVKVEYCGICHSDLSLIDGTFPAMLPVVTQGHEASGTVAAVGPDVEGWTGGDRVIPAAGRPCLTCRNCRRGDLNSCLASQLMAFSYDGAWAEYTVSLAVGLTRIPDNVPFEQAAILADAVSTPFGAVVRTAKVGLGESVGVWGVGGIGTHIVQLARLVGALPVLAFDVNPVALRRALDVGADYAFDARDDELAAKVAEVTGGLMLDVAFDAVGLKVPFEQAFGCVGVGGRMVAVGYGAEDVTVGSTMMLGLTQRQVLGHLGYRNEDIGTLARLVSSGRLDVSGSVGEIVALEDIAEGVRKLANHEGDSIRILVRP